MLKTTAARADNSEVHSGHCTLTDRLRRSFDPRPSEGVTLVEVIIALALLLTISLALAGTLTSSIAANGLARQRTAADEVATEQLETIRRLPYDQVGTVNGNPPGNVQALSNVSVDGLLFTVRIRILFVDDPVPGLIVTAANYKQVVATVTSASSGLQLAREVTNIAPPGRAAFGGVNKAVIRAQVVDMKLATGVADATVDLTGPSPRTDTTDIDGNALFAALTPTTGSQFYDLNVTAAGYETLREDQPPVGPGPPGPAHAQLAPGQTFTTALRVYRPATINVVVNDALGNLYTGAATVTVGSSRAAQEFAVTGGRLTVTQLGGELIVPGLQYTVSARASGALFSSAVTQAVPSNYPTDLTSTFTLSLVPWPTAKLNVQVRSAEGQNNPPIPGARVDVAGGPRSLFLSGVANSGGVINFDVPIGPGYGITARGGNGEGSGQATANVIGPGTTVVQVDVSSGGN